MIHHKTWFPLIVVALSVLLGFFIYSTFKDRAAESTRTPVSSIEYQAEVHQTAGDLRLNLSRAADDAERLALLEATRDELLTLLVPADYRDVHLEMVMTISTWIAGYKGDAGKRGAAEARWQAIVDQYPWIE